jgi:hypothetical protein
MNIGVNIEKTGSPGKTTLNRKLGYGIILVGLVMEAGYLYLTYNLGDLTANVRAYLLLNTALLALTLGTIAYLVPGFIKTKVSPKAGLLPEKNQNVWQIVLIILIFAGLFRLTAVFAEPSLSTDQFRYIWEGRLVTLGISPYRYAPNDSFLIPYHSEVFPLVRQAGTPSPYPPLTQLVHALNYAIFQDNLIGPKVFYAGFDFINCLIIIWLLGVFGRDRRWVLLYAWHPLPVVEFGQSGHNDALMLGLLLVAIGLAYRQKPFLSAAILGLAALAKFTPLFGLPLFLVLWHKTLYKGQIKWNFWQIFNPRLWLYPFLTIVILVAGYIPFLISGQGAIGSLADYIGMWENNATEIFLWLKTQFGLSLAKQITVGLLGVTVLVLAFLPKLAVELSLCRRFIILFGVTFMLASSLHPWYLSWILVMLPLVWGDNFSVWWDWGCLLFTYLIQLTYLTYGLEPTLSVEVGKMINPLISWSFVFISLTAVLQTKGRIIVQGS